MMFIKPTKTFKSILNLLEKIEDDDSDFLSSLPPPDDDDKSYEVEADTEFPVIDYTEMKDLINTNYDLKLPMLVSGPPGVGKTELIETASENIAKNLTSVKTGQPLKFINFKDINESNINEIIENITEYFIFMDIRVASLEPSDMQGIPNIRDKRDFLVFKIPAWAYLCTQPGSHGILFFDEINQGRPDVLNTLFSVSHPKERKLGAPPRRLGEGWGIMAAGNFGNYGNEKLKQALISRYKTYSLKPDVESWLEWAKSRTPPIYKQIYKFVEVDPNKNFYKVPEAGEEKQFPSPRSFETLSKSLYSLENRAKDYIKRTGKPIPKIYSLITKEAQATCGNDWAQRFRHFLLVTRDLTLEKIAKGKLLSRDRVVEIDDGMGGKKKTKEPSTNMDNAYTYIQKVVDDIGNTMMKHDVKKSPETKKLFYEVIGFFNEIVATMDDEDLILALSNKIQKSYTTFFNELIRIAGEEPSMKAAIMKTVKRLQGVNVKVRNAYDTLSKG